MAIAKNLVLNHLSFQSCKIRDRCQISLLELSTTRDQPLANTTNGTVELIYGWKRLIAVNYFCKKLHLRYLTGFWIRLYVQDPFIIPKNAWSLQSATKHQIGFNKLFSLNTWFQKVSFALEKAESWILKFWTKKSRKPRILFPCTCPLLFIKKRQQKRFPKWGSCVCKVVIHVALKDHG